jgi:VWFA-related protein
MRLVITVIVSLLLAPTVAAQETPSGTFGGTVEVRVVNVQVVVTDDQGKRVAGLSPEDFRLVVDGQDVAVDYFGEIADGVLAAPAAATAGAPRLPATSVDGPDAAVGTGYLVFIDDFFPLKVDRDRALTNVVELLDELGPNDSMAILAFDGDGIDKLSDWTASRDTLRATLEAARDRTATGYNRRWEAQEVESETEMFNYVKRLLGQTETAIAAATSAMRAVRPPMGRKVMVLLSGGWPLDPSRLLPMDEQRYMTQRNLTGGPKLFQSLIDTANLSGWTLYPADVPGLQEESLDATAADQRSFDVDEVTRLQLDAPASLPAVPQTEEGTQDVATLAESIRLNAPDVRPGQREREDQYAMRLIAEETGGTPLINQPLDALFVDSKTYYWLGFSPEVKGDNQRHDIHVVTRDPSLRVRARTSFVDFSPQTQTTMRVESALLAGGTGGASSLRVTVGEIQNAKKRRVIVPLEITIPTDEVTAITTTDGYEIRLELRAAALDDWGRPSDIPVIPVVFTSPNPPAPGGHATYRTSVELRRNTHDVLVTIYDPRIDHLLAERLELEF